MNPLTQSHIDIIGAIAFGLFLLVMGCVYEPEPWTKEEQCQYWNKFNDNGVLGRCE